MSNVPEALTSCEPRRLSRAATCSRGRPAPRRGARRRCPAHSRATSVGRYYDPGTGQFLAVDPLVDETGQPYAYTGGDPVNGTDPSGLDDTGPENNAYDEVEFDMGILAAEQQLAAEAVAAANYDALTAAEKADMGVVPEGDPTTGENYPTVSVYHGSINDASSIAQDGLDPTRSPTWVTRDLAAAEDAVGPSRVELMHDPGIIESQIPASEFEQVLQPLERGYAGFNGALGVDGSSEIVLHTAEEYRLFNTYITGLR